MTSKVTIDSASIARKVEDRVKEIQKGLRGNPLLNQVGDEIIKDNRREARTGKGFDSKPEIGQKRTKMPPLADSTIDARDYLKRAGNSTDNVFSLKRSNLTVSGQLLSSIVKEIKKGALIIRLSDQKRAPYKTLNQRQSRSKKAPPSNQEVADFLEEQGRHFLGIDDKTEKKIKTIVIRFIRRLIRS